MNPDTRTAQSAPSGLEHITREASQHSGAILRTGDRVRVHTPELAGAPGVIVDFDLGGSSPGTRVRIDGCEEICCAPAPVGNRTLSTPRHGRYDIDLIEPL